MADALIQDWTESQVLLKFNESRDVKYRVYRNGEVLYQDKDPKGGKEEISDHLPLWAEFSIRKLSQELDQILNPGG